VVFSGYISVTGYFIQVTATNWWYIRGVSSMFVQDQGYIYTANQDFYSFHTYLMKSSTDSEHVSLQIRMKCQDPNKFQESWQNFKELRMKQKFLHVQIWKEIKKKQGWIFPQQIDGISRDLVPYPGGPLQGRSSWPPRVAAQVLAHRRGWRRWSSATKGAGGAGARPPDGLATTN
jgi:hypothetical protein